MQLSILEHMATNSNGYTYVFGVKLSNVGTSDFVGRRCALEIQDSTGSQITGSTNNFAGFTDTHVTFRSKNNTW